MFDLKNADSFHIGLYLIVPGLIAIFMRAQFLTGRMEKHADAVLTYFTISLVYWALVMLTGVRVAELINRSLSSVFIVFVGPLCLGTLLGLNARFDFLRGVLSRLNMNPVHPVPTAWDWYFQRAQSQFVLVTLIEGEVVAGRYGARSFASSDPSERDLYIEQLFEVDEYGTWSEATPPKGILLKHNQIRYVEFFQ